jgi:threonine synthase
VNEPPFRCSGCGAEVTPDRASPLPFRCPRLTPGDDIDHVLVRVRPPGVTFRPGPEQNPFLRYRALSAAHALATREGLPDAAYVAIVERLDAAVASLDGHGFRVTPMARADRLARAVDASGAGDLELWVKDETGNVSGSHKARHLMGILVYLEVAREIGLLSGEWPRLAIASCGNAALAAAVVAGAGKRALDVFIPPDANARVVERLVALGAHIEVCTRTASSPAGDPCYHGFREAIAHGALPFCCQGGDNGVTIDGGETLGYEIAEHAPPLDALFVQVGGGALASSIVQGLRVAQRGGALAKLPRLFAVQTRGAFPLARAYDRVASRLALRAPSGIPTSAGARAEWLRDHAAAWIDEELAYAARHRSEFMWPWEETPHSVAHGILDDETYDWLSIVRGMLETGGHPIVVDEETLLHANRLGRDATGIAVDPTGSAGLAGLLELRKTDARPGRHAVIFSGRDRDAGARVLDRHA